jgi:threonine/homoserine/homoserine lactone efflux protein
MRFAITDIAFLRGLIAGIALAAPLGPVAILCIRRGLARGQIEGFLAGLGAALADTIFGAVAGLGVTFIFNLVIAYETLIGLIGGVILLAVGVLTYRTPVCPITGEIQVQSLRRDAVTAFTMAITNPATMLGAAGIFAVFGPINIQEEPVKAFWLVAGLFAGSGGWWLVLSALTGIFRERFIDGGLLRLNKISGAIITASGAVVLTLVAYHGMTAS